MCCLYFSDDDAYENLPQYKVCQAFDLTSKSWSRFNQSLVSQTWRSGSFSRSEKQPGKQVGEMEDKTDDYVIYCRMCKDLPFWFCSKDFW